MAVSKLDVVARIEATYEARIARDYSTALLGFAEDARFRFIGRQDIFPFMGLHVGHAAILSALTCVDRMFSIGDFFMEDILIDGERGAARWSAMVRNLETGVGYEFEAFDHLILRDGKIISFTEFADTSRMI